MPTRRPLWTLFAALALCAVSAPSTHADDPLPGLVKQRPAEGRFVETDRGFMVPYTVTIPGTEVTFDMLPIPGGTYRMGSPDDEKGHREDEGPTVEVTVPPFWMAKTEVRWAEYKEYMALYQVFKKFEAEQLRLVNDDTRIDAITAPTELYEPSFTFEYGDDPQQPAVTMTQIAAKHYSKWMSAVTGQQYRLPCEAEWEYACRAGTTTRYSFGDDAGQLGDYAWFTDNDENGGAKKVGQKKPNPWGLYDMHGNVSEWVLDGYTEDGYKRLEGKPQLLALQTIAKPEGAYPRVTRGGNWDSDAADCRSAAKMASNDEDWKANDPNLPLSPWWFTDDPARGVGFRLVRSLQEVPRAEMEKFWQVDTEDIAEDVKYRLEEGRGVLGIVDKSLPEAIEKLNARE